MKKTVFLFLFVHLLTILSAESAENREKERKPNIIMITTHDLGTHLNCYGVKTVQSPNIDRLAQKGVMFTNFFATSSVCTPSRGSLHTGRYPQSNGLMGLSHAPWWWVLNDDERHTADILGSNGFETYLIGVNHVYNLTGKERIKRESERMGYDHMLSVKNRAEETVEESIKLFNGLKRNQKPVFVKIGFQEVHRRFQNGSDSTKGIFIPPYLANTRDIREDLAAYQATIKYFDNCVGRILSALEESDIADNTLIVFTVDHGIPYTGAKWTARKAGMDIPLIIYQPGTVFSGGKVEDALMSNIDVLPTILDFAGLEIPENIEGRSYLPKVKDSGSEDPRDLVFGQFTPAMKRDNESRCVFDGKYWYIHYFNAGRNVVYPADVHPQRFAGHIERARTKGTRPFFHLYDIENDPYCLIDIGSDAKNEEVVSRLSDELLMWMRSVDDPLLKGATAVPYYDKSLNSLLNK